MGVAVAAATTCSNTRLARARSVATCHGSRAAADIRSSRPLERRAIGYLPAEGLHLGGSLRGDRRAPCALAHNSHRRSRRVPRIVSLVSALSPASRGTRRHELRAPPRVTSEGARW